MATENRQVFRVTDAEGNTTQVFFEGKADQTLVDSLTNLGDVGEAQTAFEQLDAKTAKLSSTGSQFTGLASYATALSGGSAGKIPYQSATDVTAFSAVGTTGQVLTSNGTSAPSWKSQSTLSAGFATKALQDNSGNVITSTYATKTALEEVREIAQGKTTAYVFDDVATMTSTLKAASSTAYSIGDELLIKAADTPDYWISDIQSSNSGTYGYYEITELETKTVDLDGYAKLSGGNSFSGDQIVEGTIAVDDSISITDRNIQTTIELGIAEPETQGTYNFNINFPAASGTVALTSDVDAVASDIASIENGDITVDAARTADSLATARTIALSGDATGSTSFNGSANATIKTTLANSGVTAGTYTALTVDAKGRATAGGQAIEWGTTSQTSPSSSLMVGGLFFKLKS